MSKVVSGDEELFLGQLNHFKAKLGQVLGPLVIKDDVALNQVHEVHFVRACVVKVRVAHSRYGVLSLELLDLDGFT